MSENIRRQENAFKGEARTQALLADGFWVLRRSVDVDGVDFLVQTRANSANELRHRHALADTYGFVQAKFFENRNQVRIPRIYVDSGTGVRTDFFAILHTDSEDLEQVHYFFTAAEIQESFYLNENGTDYCFSITDQRDYRSFRNRPRVEIFSAMQGLMEESRREQQESLIQLFFSTYVDVRSVERGETFTYMLREVVGCRVVICTNNQTGTTRLLEPRRDLFSYSGDFSWGYAGTGPQFMSASLLGHHLGGRAPTWTERERLLRNLVQNLWGTEYNVTTEMVQSAISTPTADETPEGQA